MTNKEIAREAFPVGFYDDLHKDFSINFQMNRFYGWTNTERMLDEMRAEKDHPHLVLFTIIISLNIYQRMH